MFKYYEYFISGLFLAFMNSLAVLLGIVVVDAYEGGTFPKIVVVLFFLVIANAVCACLFESSPKK